MPKVWRWLLEALAPGPRISPRRALEAWNRQEMDRHPIERDEPFLGEAGEHFPVGVNLRPGDLAKRPVFSRRAA